MIRRIILSLLAGGLGLWAHAQQGFAPLDKWDHTSFVAYTRLHPMQIVRADNNWQLLWALRSGQTLAALKADGVPYTESQLLLLRDAGMIQRTQEGRWRSCLPILDSLQTSTLRAEAKATAGLIYPEIEEGLRNLAALLDKQGFAANTYVILFSHLLDGTIWDEFDRRKITSTLPEYPGWEGHVWFCYPKYAGFRPGTNTYPIDEHHTLNVCWAEGDPAFTDQIADQSVIQALEQVLRHGSPDSLAATQALSLTDGRQLTIPVISRSGPAGKALQKLTRELCQSFLRHTDMRGIEATIATQERSLAVLVFYHEVMWQLNRQLLEATIVPLPKIFADPTHAQPRDMAALCFITRN